jgi:hypothetical protein
MNKTVQHDREGVTGGPLDIKQSDLVQPPSDRALQGKKAGELEPDELTRIKAAAELSREKNDAYLVGSDLEDDDQRGPAPGMKNQD